MNWENPTLTGTLVRLRSLGADDADVMWEMVNEPEGNDLTATTETFSHEQIQSWCESRPGADQRLDLAVIELATDEMAGEIVLNEYNAVANDMSFRIALRGPHWFGRGLGTDATQLILRLRL